MASGNNYANTRKYYQSVEQICVCKEPGQYLEKIIRNNAFANDWQMKENNGRKQQTICSYEVWQIRAMLVKAEHWRVRPTVPHHGRGLFVGFSTQHGHCNVKTCI